jgi:hypothetical protein
MKLKDERSKGFIVEDFANLMNEFAHLIPWLQYL